MEVSAIPSTSQEAEGSHFVETVLETSVLETSDQPDVSPACVNCAHLSTENRKLSRDVKDVFSPFHNFHGNYEKATKRSKRILEKN